MSFLGDFILGRAVILFAQQLWLRKTYYPSSYEGETNSRNFDENEKATTKATTKPNLPTVNGIKKVRCEF